MEFSFGSPNLNCIFFKILAGSSEYFEVKIICQPNQNYSCLGCYHYNFLNLNHLTQNIIWYCLQVLVTGFSQFVGLGAEIQKTSVTMGLLKYNEYEATNVTYFISIGSSLTYFLFVLFYFKEANHIDFQAVQLLFPIIVILTDLGNFINRKIQDQIIVFIVIAFEFIWILMLPKKYYKQKKEEENQSEMFKTMTDAFDINRLQPTNSQILVKQTKSDLYQVGYIIVFQIFLQSLLICFRGGNKYNLMDLDYSGLTYWIVTGIIYSLSIGFTILIFRYQDNDYKEMGQEANPNFYNFRSSKENIYLIIIGCISIFCSGVAGVGAGLILMPCFMLIPQFHMTITKAINTMVLIQFLVDLCVIMQALININSLILEDQFFFIGLGTFSVFVLTISLHQYINKDEKTLLLIQIVFILFFFDFCLSTYQAKTFKSPNEEAGYFSISIDDCSENCQYQEPISQ